MSAVARKPYRTLVLNSTHVPLSTWPLSIVPAEEAVHAMYRDRCYSVEDWPDAFFHSPSTAIAVPKVVALRHYANVSGAPKFSRRNVLMRDSWCCQYCGKRVASQDLSFDHVIPRAKGGETVWENILTACTKCNALKKDQDAQWSARKGSGLRPLKLPRRPTSAELLRSGLQFLPDDLVENFADFLYWGVKLER